MGFKQIILIFSSQSIHNIETLAGLGLTLPVSFIFAKILRASRDEGEEGLYVYSKWHQVFLVKVVLLEWLFIYFKVFVFG